MCRTTEVSPKCSGADAAKRCGCRQRGRFNTSEVEVIKEGDQLTLRPRGKNWGAYFEARSRGHLPARDQPNLDERNEIALMFMLDTDLCIYIINERDAALKEKFEANAEAICISSITYAELRFGVAHSTRVERNARELDAFCLDLDVLPFDTEAGVHYGDIRHALSQPGRLIGANDLLIAGHARSVGAILVTNNQGEFGRVPDLAIENWVSNA